MQFKELTTVQKGKALINARLQGNFRVEDDALVSSLFTFYNSIEGHDYWYEISFPLEYYTDKLNKTIVDRLGNAKSKEIDICLDVLDSMQGEVYEANFYLFIGGILHGADDYGNSIAVHYNRLASTEDRINLINELYEK